MRTIERNGEIYVYSTAAREYLEPICGGHIARGIVDAVANPAVGDGSHTLFPHKLVELMLLVNIAKNMETCEGCRSGACYIPRERY